MRPPQRRGDKLLPQTGQAQGQFQAVCLLDRARGLAVAREIWEVKIVSAGAFHHRGVGKDGESRGAGLSKPLLEALEAREGRAAFAAPDHSA